MDATLIDIFIYHLFNVYTTKNVYNKLKIIYF